MCVRLSNGRGSHTQEGERKGGKEGRGSGVEGLAAKEEANQSLAALFLREIAFFFLLNAIHGCGGLLPREP